MLFFLLESINRCVKCYNITILLYNNVYVNVHICSEDNCGETGNGVGYEQRLSGSPMNNSVSISELWLLKWPQLVTASFR